MSSNLSPNFLRMIRDDFVALLRHDHFRSAFSQASDRRLALDLDALGGIAGEW